MGTAPQLCRRVLSCLTRQPQLLALQQLPFLQQQTLGEDHFPQQPAAVCNSSSSTRSYARLPESPGSQAAYARVRHPQQQPTQQAAAAADRPYPKISDGPVQKIYRGKWIIPVRFLVRGKIFQLLGGGGIAFVIGSATMSGAGWGDMLALTGLAGGMVAGSYCLWYYSRRYVGEMSLLLPERRHVRFSVLDFWGNREDNDVPLEAIQTFAGVRPKEVSHITSQLLFPLTITGDRQYYFNNIHESHILEPEIFFSILRGEFDPSAEQQQSSTQQQQQQQEQQEPSQEQQQLQQAREQQQQQQQQAQPTRQDDH
ncbi:hypothetical protein OEZ85_003562 [Tetradesmus obliquus]|uniref:Transmembrane protein 186 n=1 Tax=Tetradesmus obliquus TaxID=3088 RepID=A0ABY8UCH2_TETOB|nr:hypothetical protein OEZ85_003562 [Tetradesmus obliquus]